MSVVDARVVDPETARFVRLREFAKRVVKAAIPPVMLRTVVEARVDEAVANRLIVFVVVAFVVVA